MGGAVQTPPGFLLLFFVPSAPQKCLPGLLGICTTKKRYLRKEREEDRELRRKGGDILWWC